MSSVDGEVRVVGGVEEGRSPEGARVVRGGREVVGVGVRMGDVVLSITRGRL